MSASPFRTRLAWVFGAAVSIVATAPACGGRTTGAASGSNGGAETGNGGSGGSGSGTPLTCTPSGGGGSSSGSGCSVSTVGTCDDGSSFDVSCACPAGTCQCSRQTASGATEATTITASCPDVCSEGGGSALVDACDFSSSGTTTPAPDAGLPACTIPSSMQPPSGTGSWSIGRALLSCNSGGLGTLCLSNDGVTCPNDPVTAGGSCTDECAPGQYAVAYDGPPLIGGGSYLQPPLVASCTSGPAVPSGAIFVCCPCQ